MRRWLNQEISWAIAGPKAVGSGAELHKARSLQQDYRLAQAMVELNPNSLDPFEKVKVYLSRGELALAQATLASLQLDDPYDIQEQRHEQVRLAIYEGDWILAKSLADQLIEAGGVGLTTQSAFQMRATINVELGDLDAAFADIEKVEVLAAMYPHSFSNFHARCQRVRGLALTGATEEAHNLRASLWTEVLREKEANFDFILSLARLEALSTSVGTLDLKDITTWIQVQAELSLLLGDDLYLALAILYADKLGCQIHGLEKPYPSPRKTYRRIKVLKEAGFTEGFQLKTLSEQAAIESQKGHAAPLSRLTGVFFSQSQRYLNFEKRTLESLSPRQVQLLNVCHQFPGIEIAEAFHKMTDLAFSKRVHGNYLSNLAYQINKKLGPIISIRDQRVFAIGLGVVSR